MSQSPDVQVGPSKPIQPKYNVGDYITSTDHVILQIHGVVPSDPSNPLYGAWNEYAQNNGKQALIWFTQYELDKKGFDITIPAWDKWNAITVNDMVHVGISKERAYVKVLARVGDLVMLSDAPTPRKEKQALDKIATQVEELTEGHITKVEITEALGGKQLTMSEAHKTSISKWWTVHELALMNWELIVGEA